MLVWKLPTVTVLRGGAGDGARLELTAELAVSDIGTVDELTYLHHNVMDRRARGLGRLAAAIADVAGDA